MNNYDRAVINKQAAKLGFIRESFEKVCRMAELLSFFERDPVLSRYLALKGGVAINMTIFNMPRLSEGFDFDFAENLTLEETTALRETIRDAVRRLMDTNGYKLTSKPKDSPALDSDVYCYISSAYEREKIKVDISYPLRSHVMPLAKRPVETLGFFAPSKVLSLDPVEIFASKIVALSTRASIRDLYDVRNMIHAKLFDETQTEALRKCVVFYTAIETKNTPDSLNFDKIDALAYRDIRMNLMPILRKQDPFDLNTMRKQVREYLTELMTLSDDEKLFLTSFRNGKYLPELLYSGETLERVRNHPVSIWEMIDMVGNN